MSDRNGYFMLTHKSDGIYLKLIPAVDNGKKIDMDEVKSYLFRRDIYDFSQKAVKNAINSNMETEVKLEANILMEANEEIYISQADNNMSAVAKFYPPSEGGDMITESVIRAALRENGISAELDVDVMNDFFSDRKYATEYIIARGIPPTEGHNARIDYTFNIDKTLKPKLNDDGTVDFHNLDNINNVSEGDLLATLVPAVQGSNGIDIYGKNVKCKDVTKKKLKYGKNVFISDDNLKLYSAANGHVVLANDTVSVSSVYEVKSNVNMTTGDIQCKGDVHVSGSVLTGFTVIAEGNISVDGVVEGAILKAGGNIVVKQGIQGMKRGAISAGGDIVAKFIENACVVADGTVHTETIMHSNITAKGSIVVTSNKGFIVGGVIRSAREIMCKTAGSIMETQTILQIGSDEESEEELKKIERQITKLQNDQEECLRVIRFFKNKMDNGEYFSKEKVFTVKELVKKNKEINEKINGLIIQYDGLKRYLEVQVFEDGSVMVEGVTNLGVKIVISGVIFYVRNETFCTKFKRVRADVIPSALTDIIEDDSINSD